MVVLQKPWLPVDLRLPAGPQASLGILAFEAAAAMSKLLSLHRSLTDQEVSRLRSDAMRSPGVAYLNSTDQAFLLRLACAELVVSPAAAAALAAQQQQQQQMQGVDSPEAESIRQELKTQRLKVKRLKDESLWNQSYDKAVGLMARAACAVFVRICAIFGAFVPGLPPPLPAATTDSVQTRLSKLLLLNPRSGKTKAASGPITRRDGPSRVHPPVTSNSCPIIGLRPSGYQKSSTTDWRKVLDAPPSTVGGAGLDQQYASVITSAEELLQMEAEGRQEEAAVERAEMYEMLPAKLKAAVRSKLREWWRDPGPLDEALARGWKDGVDRIMVWLGPMARDTARWQAERNMDRTRRFDGAPRVYALQTLRWADKEKAEAAIVEVLVALSCICWYEERRRGSVRLG